MGTSDKLEIIHSIDVTVFSDTVLILRPCLTFHTSPLSVIMARAPLQAQAAKMPHNLSYEDSPQTCEPQTITKL